MQKTLSLLPTMLSRLAATAAVVFMLWPRMTSAQINEPVRVKSGLLSGMTSADAAVRIFKGVPFAAPPVGNLRWREPQPVKDWKGVRKADHFGARPMQLPLYGDMVWRSEGDQ